MNDLINIDWEQVTPEEAVALQKKLRDRVRLEDDFGEVKTVAGVDVSIRRGWAEGTCGIVVLSFPELEVIETQTHKQPITFPYIPGLLAFREIPIFLKTYEKLSIKPNILFFDGHGYAHPRRMGIATHAGIILDHPTIGCAKSKLIGYYTEPAREAGSMSPLIEHKEQIGVVLRTKDGVNPVFISPGNKISFESAVRFALACSRGYRIPEPTRLAHNLVSGGR